MKDVVIFVSPHNNLYGAERSMLAIIKKMKQKDIDSVVIIPDHGPIEEELNQIGSYVIVQRYFFWINEQNKIKDLIKYYCNYLIAFSVKKKLRNMDCNALTVHTNSIITPFGAQLSRVLNVKHLQHIREFGTLDFHMSFNFGWPFMSKLINKSAKIICISNSVSRYFGKYFDTEKLITIYNGIPVIENIEKKMVTEFRILLVGRLSREKGQIDAIKAVESLIRDCGYTDIKMDLFGSGQDKNTLSEYIKKHGLQYNVFLKGYSKEIDYSNYCVGIMSSQNEAFGRVTVEYMMNGLAVVGAKSGGTQEIVVNNVTGLTYDPGNVCQLKECLKNLYENRQKAQLFGENGRLRAVECFSEEAYCSNIYKLYQELEIV